METIEAIRRIKAELPGASTILGLSNVSFGLKPAARHVLNSVFLHECREAGLDAAIVHAARIMPMHRIDDRQREVALDLIYDRRRDELRPAHRVHGAVRGRRGRRGRARGPFGLAGRRAAEAPHHRRRARRPRSRPRRAARRRCRALDIINDVLLDGMKVVGELFGSGQMQLPFVLQSAETMKAAVAYLEPHMEKVDGARARARSCSRPCKGDVHDIGKNLVDIILTNNGYTVYNLGIKVADPRHDREGARGEGRRDRHERPAREEHDHHAREPRGAERARARRHVPVLLGGAALTRTYVEDDLRERLRRPRVLRQGRVRGPAHDGHARAGQARRHARPRVRARGGRAQAAAPQVSERDERRRSRSRRAPTSPSTSPVFTPPFLGSRVAKGISLDDIAGYVNETALFRNQWQFRPDKTSNENDDEFKERIRPVLREQLDVAKAEGLLVPAVAWGYFAVNSEGNDLIVWKDDDRARRSGCGSTFPRQRKAPFL